MFDDLSLTELDRALLANGFQSEALAQHPGLERTDEPPRCSGVRLADPTFAPAAPEPRAVFPEKAESAEMARSWEIECMKRLLELYEAEKEQLADVVSESYKSQFEDTSFDSRAKFFFSQLLEVANAPLACECGGFMGLMKLWRNKQFEIAKRGDAHPEQCCSVEICPNVAMHGSKYCIWHILMDEQQTFFVECDKCGWPKLKRDNPEEEVHNCT